MTTALSLASGVFGLLIGSFLNVVVWRVPRGLSVNRPASACPRCGHPIRARDNVPVLSWLLLRGRCRDCGMPISARYPLVEVATGVAFALVAAWQGAGWMRPALAYLAALTIALSLIDIEHHRLPDALVLPAYPVAAALLALASASPGGQPHWDALGRAAAGAAVLAVFYTVLWLVYPRGMGRGDVKLSGVLGLYLGYLGWGAVVVGGFSAFLLGGLFSGVLLVTGRAGRGSKVPFGPWMLAGCWLGLVVGESVWTAYLGLL